MSGDVWYLDTSAFVKLVRREQESHALIRWLSGRRRVSSDLLRTEARRVLIGEEESVLELCHDLLGGLILLRLTPATFDRAGQLLPDQRLRSLDAVHLAAAESLGGDLAGIVAYDQRLISSAEQLDVPTASPA